jgi:hypothetical protein
VLRDADRADMRAEAAAESGARLSVASFMSHHVWNTTVETGEPKRMDRRSLGENAEGRSRD